MLRVEGDIFLYDSYFPTTHWASIVTEEALEPMKQVRRTPSVE